ncbi:MAG: transglycosylase SLT domain-containing protein [Chloroflexota bacterium]|nr:transglycosylase SLT domain-containing protein [Chloroflexota bacterium]
MILIVLLRLLLLLLLAWFSEATVSGPGERGGSIPSLLGSLSVQVAEELSLTPLGEILDEPLGEIFDEPFGEEPIIDPPSEDSANPAPPDNGVGGAIGGGVSEGPEAGATAPPPPATSTTAPLPPTATPPPPVATSTTAPLPPTGTPPPPPTVPASTATVTAPSTIPPTPTIPVQLNNRLDDPVLRWLPELSEASRITGIPVALLAAVIQLESGGDPSQISVDGGRGLTGVQPADLIRLGVPQELWHAPEQNILASAQVLMAAFQTGGSWSAALAIYVGPACASARTCVEPYIAVAVQWREYYDRVLTDPVGAGFRWLPADWTPPAIVPYQLTAPRPLMSPPGYVMPTTIVEPTMTAVATNTPQATPTQLATATSTAVSTSTVAPMAAAAETLVPIAPTPTELAPRRRSR